jgi:hypothetical protein
MQKKSLLAVFLGLLSGLPVHVAGLALGMIACVLTGLAPDGPWPAEMQRTFVLSFGLWQWAYLLPATIWLGRRRPGFAIGLALSGFPGLLISLLMLLSAILAS